MAQPGVGGLVMGIAALIGVIATFLPLASVSVSVMGMTCSTRY
jgi:hypothetical protein